ncbi:MAG: sigma-70 family RNA polymerase sigma factor, partial [Planctomycetota bacterium]|nr:sigma-70 family RNA polymerase sigma factor [Planctomycetota bacterium]
SGAGMFVEPGNTLRVDADELASLVLRAQRRDPEAFADLVEALRPRLWARARSLAGDAAAAEDLFQETCLRAYEHLDDLKEPRAAASWMLTILDRLGRRAHAKDGARETPLEPSALAQAFEGQADAGQALLELAEHAETSDELRRALARLDEDERELLALRFGAERNATEIAAELGVSPEAVRARLCRIIARLRDQMGVRT